MTGGDRAIGVVALVLMALVPLAARAGGEFSIDPAEMHAAKKAARSFSQPGGIARAMRAYCRASDDARHAAAYTVLVERGARAMPRLLDAIVLTDTQPQGAFPCGSDATEVAVKAVCDGHDDGDLYELDRRPDAAIRRGRRAARKALVRALARKGPRRAAALSVVLETRRCEDDDARRALVRQATPALVRLLAAPKLEMDALRALAMGGADAKVARGPLRARLGDDRTVALAATALAPMHEDLHAVVPRLARLLGGPRPAPVVRALGAIGVPARPALPAMARLAERFDPSECDRPVKVGVMVKAVGRIGVDRGRSLDASRVLTPLLECSGTVSTVAEALVSFGANPARSVVFYMERAGHTLRDRADAARVLVSAHVPLSDRDRLTADRLAAKMARLSRPVPQVPPSGPPPTGLELATDALTRCRFDAHLRPAPKVIGVPDAAAAKLAECLDRYLCGPSRHEYRQVLGRCCVRAFGNLKPPLCHE